MRTLRGRSAPRASDIGWFIFAKMLPWHVSSHFEGRIKLSLTFWLALLVSVPLLVDHSPSGTRWENVLRTKNEAVLSVDFASSGYAF